MPILDELLSMTSSDEKQKPIVDFCAWIVGNELVLTI